MTAEVGVLNSLAVALAADSAVTIGTDKIYTSADKIFQLSCSAPIGVMIYGNADLVDLPWETVIKTYRQHLGERRFDTVAGYAEDLIDYLENGSHEMFPEKQQHSHACMVVYSLFDELRASLWKRVRQEVEEGKDADDDTIDELLQGLLGRYLENVLAQDLLPGFAKKDIAIVGREYGGDIETIVDEAFRPGLPAKTRAALKKLAAEALCRKVPTSLTSGIVVTGFGERDFMPMLVSYEIDEMVLGRLRRVQKGDPPIKIHAGNRACVVPFAQQEMVHSFMQGIEPSLLQFMRGSTQDLFKGVVAEIFDLVAKADPEIGARLEKEVSPKVDAVVSALLEGWEEKSREIWQPVLRITEALPKDELAAMAEALVNLTKFRRRVTMERETVGGPIDVAVITKGDGFVWIRRKHYFGAEYNPRVIARYAQGG